MKKRILGFLCAVLLPLVAVAGSHAVSVTIQTLDIDESLGGTFVLIELSATPTGAPSCATNGWNYTFPFSAPGATELYAMLLSAYDAQTPVTVTGTGTCNEMSSVESLQGISLLPPG